MLYFRGQLFIMMSGSTLVGGEWREEKYAVRETETEREQVNESVADNGRADLCVNSNRLEGSNYVK